MDYGTKPRRRIALFLCIVAAYLKILNHDGKNPINDARLHKDIGTYVIETYVIRVKMSWIRAWNTVYTL